MKKALSLILALILTLSVFAVPVMAKEDHRFNFIWGDHDFDFGFDFDDDKKPEKPVTDTDAPDHDDDKDDHQKPQDKPEKPQRPVTDTDVTDTDIKDIFDAIKHMKDNGHHGKEFRMPKTNDKFMIIGMVINADGSIEFIFVEKGKEDEGEKRFPANNDVTGTDVTGTDVPEDMDFIVLGDTDVDGKVNAKDALNILKHAVKKAVMEHEGQQFLADMDENNVIDAKDALKVLRKAVGKED